MAASMEELFEEAMVGGRTWSDLSRATKLSRSTLRRLRSGHATRHSETTIHALARGLGINIQLVRDALDGPSPSRSGTRSGTQGP